MSSFLVMVTENLFVFNYLNHIHHQHSGKCVECKILLAPKEHVVHILFQNISYATEVGY